MYISIDFNSDEALYLQLRNQIVYAIVKAELREGENLPSVRDMAETVGINMHTVNKAYAMLRQEGYLQLDRRHGAIVAVDVDEIKARMELAQTMDLILAQAEKALNKAAKFAIRMGQRIVGSEHLLFGLSAAPGVAAKVLKENGMDKERLDIEVREYCGMSDVVEIEPLRGETSPKLEALLLAAAEEAGKMQLKETGTEHMLLAILKDTSCVAYKILLASGAPIQKLYTDIILTTGGDMVQAKNELIASRSRNKKNSGTPTLDQYARDLTQYAKDGKLDPVLNRDDEIESVIGILSRRMKNNPCLIGEPGVGKTAIVEGLASRIVDGAVPDTLEQKRILTLDLSGMVAGSKYRGEFEERIKRALRETKAAGNILLFIDELHTVIGAGGAEGAIDASNILKPAMARGEIQVIGATTREEYRKHIEKDAALERRFQPVVIEEPSAVQTISMLKGLRSRYEEFHKVEITDAAIEAAVQLSE